jgi:ribosomal protein S18 acetylase RimI-like enzyme
MSQILTLRRAEPDDHAFLYRLFYSTQAEKLQLWHLTPEAKERLVALIYAGFERHYTMLAAMSDDRLVLLNNEPVGRMIILQMPDEIRLADLTIVPGYRNRGIGGALIGQLQTESVMTKRPVRLRVGKYDRAFRLYQRLGFYKIEEAQPYLHLEWSRRSFSQ